MTHRQRRVGLAGAACVLGACGWLAGCVGDTVGPAPIPPAPPEPPANAPPLARGALPSAVLMVGDTLAISVSALFSDPDGDALSYLAGTTDAGVATAAASGDGVTVTGVAPGSATLTVTARDPGGLSAALSTSVLVMRPNRAPAVADTMPARTLTVGVSATVDVSIYFRDPDGDALAYAATTGDADVATASVTDAVLTLTAVAAGTAAITVTARDREGLEAAQRFEVMVRPPNRPPAVVDTIRARTLTIGESATEDLSAYFRDPDSDPLVYAATTADSGVATASVTAATLTLVAVTPGTVAITVTARDREGLEAAQRFDVTAAIPNRAPEAVEMLPALNLPAGDADMLDVSPYFRDPDGDTLTYSVTTTSPDIAAASAFGAIVTIAGVAPGRTTLTVTASDPAGLSAARSASVIVGPPNHPPEPVETIPGVQLLEGEVLRLTVAPYFNDPDGDALTYTAENPDPSVVHASVSDGALTLTGVASGSASVQVTARDPRGLSAVQEVIVTVVAVHPFRFRDDFDGPTLTDWVVLYAQTSISNGILRVTSDRIGFRGTATIEFDPPLTSWETRARVGRATTADTEASLVALTGHPRYPAYAFNIGSGIAVNGEDTNYRFYVLDTQGSQGGGWYLVRDAYGTSSAIRDGQGEFTEVTVSLRERRLRAQAGSTELFELALRDDLPGDVAAVGVWVVPRQSAASRAALFDWIEVNGLRRDQPAGAEASATGSGTGADTRTVAGTRTVVPPPTLQLEVKGVTGVGVEPTTCGLKVRCSTS